MAEGDSASQRRRCDTPSSGALWARQSLAARHSRALGARLSSSKWSGGMGHSYLGFDGHGEVVAWYRDGELSFFKLGSGSSLLRWASIQGKGWGSTRRLLWSFLTWWWGSTRSGATWWWQRLITEVVARFCTKAGRRMVPFVGGKALTWRARSLGWAYLQIASSNDDSFSNTAKG
jgi:hypothetical protein